MDRELLKKVLPHAAVWAIVLAVIVISRNNFNGIDGADRSGFVRDNALIWLVYMLVFYAGYLVLIPRLLFRRHVAGYVLLTLVLFFGSFVLINRFRTNIYVERLRKEIVEVSGRTDLPEWKAERAVRMMEQRIANALERRNSLNVFEHRAASVSYTLVIVIFFSLGIRTVQRWQAQEKALREAKQQHVESELLYLRQQINPHFLFNALNSIYSLVLPHSQDASDAVLKLSSILRYMLYETDKPMVSLEKEIDMIDDYLALQRFKFTEITEVTFGYEGEVRRKQLPPLVLVPFIENAFKYGADNVHPSFIRIALKAEGDRIRFEVENRVVCRRDDAGTGGIGINNIRRRLELIYPGEYSLETRESGGVFRVFLRMPLA